MRHFIKLPILLFYIVFQFCQPQSNVQNDKNITFKIFSRAVEQYQAYNYEDALDYINKAIDANNRIASYHELKGDILTKQGKLEEAIKEYESAKSLRSFYPEVYVKSAENYFKMGDFNMAIRNFKKAIAQRPEQANILIMLAECNIQQNELNLAKNILSDYIQQTKKQEKTAARQYYILFAKIKFEEEDFYKVVSLVEIAQKTEPLNRNETVFYIRSLIEISRHEKAYRLATKEFKNVLHASDIHFIRGLYYFHQNNFKDAKTQLSLSIKSKTTLYEAYSVLSKIYLFEGNSIKAEEVMKQGEPFSAQRLINFGLGY